MFDLLNKIKNYPHIRNFLFILIGFILGLSIIPLFIFKEQPSIRFEILAINDVTDAFTRDSSLDKISFVTLNFINDGEVSITEKNYVNQNPPGFKIDNAKIVFFDSLDSSLINITIKDSCKIYLTEFILNRGDIINLGFFVKGDPNKIQFVSFGKISGQNKIPITYYPKGIGTYSINFDDIISFQFLHKVFEGNFLLVLSRLILYSLILLIILAIGFLLYFIFSSFLNSRPPELEGAYVNFNANRICQAMANAENATDKYPENAEAWFLLGRIYGKKDRFADMVNAYDKSLALSQQFEKDINNEKLYYFQTNFNKGVTNYNEFIKLENRESEQAIKIIDKAIQNFIDAKLIKEDYKTTDLLATCYNISGRSKEALPYYQELTKINPELADAWISVGNYYFINKQYDKAVENLKKALKLEPENIEAITLIAQSYDTMEDTENALLSYEKAKTLNKEEKAFPYNLGLIYNRLANVEGIDEVKKREYFDKIIENFGEVILIDPSINVPYQIKAFAEIHQKKYENAISTLKAGIEQFPTDGALWFNLGVAFDYLLNKDEAEIAFKKAEELGYKDK